MKPSKALTIILFVASSVSLAACAGRSDFAGSSTRFSPGALGGPKLGSNGVATIPRHLYVAGSNGGTVERFRMYDGVPTSPQDLSYAGVGAPIAVAPADHALYATSSATISVFRNGSTIPERTLNISPPTSCPYSPCSGSGPTALLVDPLGYLYVALNDSSSTVSKFGRIVRISWIVQIYAPGASGDAQPISSIDVGSCQHGRIYACFGSVDGLALDSEGDLLASGFGVEWIGKKIITRTSAVYAYASPVSNPTLVRTLTGSGVVLASGLATDPSAEMYVDNPTTGDWYSGPSFVAAYPETANGNPSPDREISVAGAQFGSGIAVSPRNLLYVPDPVNNAVYELHSDRNGTQVPISVLPFASPVAVALGP